jgi:enamine deaminase RidA (YjgF/YER057c/UK114 family)
MTTNSDATVSDATVRAVEVPGWPRPKGYANGVVLTGRTLLIAGQIGWNADGVFEREDFVGQFEQALRNVLAVLRAAGGEPEHLARMTIYVTDLDAYRSSLKEVGEVWRRVLGKVFPAMALVGVAGLVETKALVEIEATASLP